MPEYRKRRRNRLFSSHPKSRAVIKRKHDKENDIIMTPDDSVNAIKAPKNANMKVVKGKKAEKKKKFKFFTAVAVAVLVVCFVLEMVFPAGLVRTVKNTISVIGSGSLPIELESTNTIDVKPLGNYYYLLTNTHIYA